MRAENNGAAALPNFLLAHRPSWTDAHAIPRAGALGPAQATRQVRFPQLAGRAGVSEGEVARQRSTGAPGQRRPASDERLPSAALSPFRFSRSGEYIGLRVPSYFMLCSPSTTIPAALLGSTRHDQVLFTIRLPRFTRLSIPAGFRLRPRRSTTCCLGLEKEKEPDCGFFCLLATNKRATWRNGLLSCPFGHQ